MERLDSFFSRLKPGARDLVPVTFRTMSTIPRAEMPPVRLAESRRHRAPSFECCDFWKPISRVLPPHASSSDLSGEPIGRRKTGEGHKAEREPGTVFLLYACCVPVAGASRSSITDLQRGSLQLIPNGLYGILTEHRGATPEAIKAAYGGEFDEVIDEYFEFLIDRDLGFWCAEPESFPELELDWETPDLVTNAVIDVDEGTDHDFRTLFRDLDALGCNALELRFFAGGRAAAVAEVLGCAKGTGLRTIEILVPFHREDTEEVYRRLAIDHQRLSRITVHGAPLDRATVVREVAVPIVFRTAKVTSALCCGQVHSAYFTYHLTAFTEARRHNSCLNRKVAIDARGEIRNCPSMERSFGNVRQVSLTAALAGHEFKELWAISKDQIEICRDCEFRYVCTDCRAFLKRSEDRFSKPAKCSYDPYTAEWASS